MADDRTIFDEPHHQSLELLAARALAAGDNATAFKLADRRCRIMPPPEPHCYVLRAEASFNFGAKAAAIIDLAKALEIAPDNVAANRRMLAWADGTQQLRAARAIIRHDHNPQTVRNATKTLHANGERTFATVTVFDDAIEGWAVWDSDAPLEISITDDVGEITAKFVADAFHFLREYGYATGFRVRRPKSVTPQIIHLAVAGSIFHSTRAAGNDSAPEIPVRRPRPKNGVAERVTVIVPVYADYEATRVCIQTLLEALRGSRQRIIFVDDATPEPRIARYLARFAADPLIDVISNACNIGFIGSVNRALERIKEGDVIILNSDTIVPRGFVDRLAAAARSSPTIGTVTPLSNNGEFVNFPIPFTGNPMASRRQVERIDAIAAKANSDKVVDIPSGIGFCLYITRACLDRVGSLSEDFARGYLEDVDFCLRARERGFRSICAPSVYVGHAGSKSFAEEKRSLVVRNLRVLEQRFPYHRAECAAFMEADPLRDARHAIECAAASVSCHPRLLITGPGVVGAIARQRAGEIASAEEPALILEVRYQPDGAIVRIKNAAGDMPQTLQFNLSHGGERESLIDFIKSNEPSRIEILDPASTPLGLVDLLLTLKLPYDMFFADAGFLGRDKEWIFPTSDQPLAACQRERRAEAPVTTVGETKSWAGHWRRIAEGAQRIIVPCPQAEAFAARVLPASTRDKMHRAYDVHRPMTRKGRKVASPHLGFVPVRSCAHEQWLMVEATRRLATRRPDISTTVIGAALDDIGLMRSSNAFVTGAVDPREFKHLVNALVVEHLFVATTRPLFGHPTLSVALSSLLPIAYFDWSMGQCTPNRKDLAIDPHSSLDEVIGELSRWIPHSD
jgi:O-antigen biosynthesis protein